MFLGYFHSPRKNTCLVYVSWNQTDRQTHKKTSTVSVSVIRTRRVKLRRERATGNKEEGSLCHTRKGNQALSCVLCSLQKYIRIVALLTSLHSIRPPTRVLVKPGLLQSSHQVIRVVCTQELTPPPSELSKRAQVTSLSIVRIISNKKEKKKITNMRESMWCIKRWPWRRIGLDYLASISNVPFGSITFFHCPTFHYLLRHHSYTEEYTEERESRDGINDDNNS